MKSLMINGEPREAEATTLETLFEELGLPAPLLLVEYNGQALHRSEWQSIFLTDGDRLELMSVAAGG